MIIPSRVPLGSNFHPSGGFFLEGSPGARFAEAKSFAVSAQAPVRCVLFTSLVGP